MRDRYLAYIERHDVAWELAFASLAIAYVVVGLLDESTLVLVVEAGLTAVFAAEFGSRLLASHDRTAYLRGHWIDLLALIPTTRALRLFRLLRLLRLVRAFAGFYRAAMHVPAVASHKGLAQLFAAWGTVMILCSIALYAAENGVNEAIDSPLDALWWGVVTLTTVGYGDVYPVTPEGRLAAAALMLLGIGLFSAITAIVTSYVLGSGAERRRAADRLRELEELRTGGLVDDHEYGTRRIAILEDV